MKVDKKQIEPWRQSVMDLNEKCRKAYRRRAGLSDDDVITEENLDEWVLDGISNKYYYDKKELKEMLLNGDEYEDF